MDCKCGCETFAEHIRGIQFQGWGAAAMRAKERRIQEDMGAFKRMKDDGMAVGKFTGARNLERAAEIPQEVKLGMVLPKDVKTALKQGDGQIVGL